MMDRDLALALRSSRPSEACAYARLFDAYGDELYRACRAFLRDPDSAQAALRDTFIVAGAHIHRLDDAGRLREWLLAVARAECEHHRLPEPAAAHLECPDPRPEPPDPRSGDRGGEPFADPPPGLRLRVLSGALCPGLDGHREHVADRADAFDADGFPVPPSRRGRDRVRALLPRLAVAACAVLLVVLAVYVYTRADTERVPTWMGVPPMASR
ncbi:RNA polymerase sigma factor [Nocardiopsis suaedae]|uniref:Sigma factor n=1 Tax=Nocardiopsis suaedae TaxID=3018444 RepID=A0ABT4TLQ5_9ACTN|nr:sigma factor [Nocardiopsis suaedae]MDA2805628.1 sigma factor [Nocardiopsis suaedae]